MGIGRTCYPSSQLRDCHQFASYLQRVRFVLSASGTFVIEDDKIFAGLGCKLLDPLLRHAYIRRSFGEGDIVDLAITVLFKQRLHSFAFLLMHRFDLLAIDELFQIGMWSVNDVDVDVVVVLWRVEASIADFGLLLGSWNAHCEIGDAEVLSKAVGQCQYDLKDGERISRFYTWL